MTYLYTLPPPLTPNTLRAYSPLFAKVKDFAVDVEKRNLGPTRLYKRARSLCDGQTLLPCRKGGSLGNNAMTGLKHIEATLNYLLDTGEKPVYYLYPPPPGTPQRTGQSIKHTLPIHDGRARFTAHTGFDDPTTPADAPARESIEARMLVFFGPESKAQG